MERIIDDVEEVSENEHIIKMWEPLDFDIDQEYHYIEEEKIFRFFSNVLYYLIAYPIISIVNKVVYDLKIEGIENVKDLQGGAISVSNHVLFLDCSMVGLALKNKKVYYTSLESTFKVPIIRKLIKLLRAVPIPTGAKNKENFIKAISKTLEDGNVVHFYPEAALWPYHSKIRNFKNGAFKFAVENKVPIIPIVITFREPKGIRKLFKRKKDVTVKVLKPIKYINENISVKQNAEELKKKVHEVMNESMEKIVININ